MIHNQSLRYYATMEMTDGGYPDRLIIKWISGKQLGSRGVTDDEDTNGGR